MMVLPMLVLLTGCHSRIRLGSPQIQRSAPQLTCIVIIESDKMSDEIAKEAIRACKEVKELQP
jgi:hypothetical protein